MANTDFLQLPVAIGLTGAEYVPLVQGGVDKRATTAQIANIATGFIPSTSIISAGAGIAISDGGLLIDEPTISLSLSGLTADTAMVVADSFAINQASTSLPRITTFPNAMKALTGLSTLSIPSLTADFLIINHAADGLTYKISPSSLGLAAGNVPAGGTTGQVLAKASNTNYDTTWINNSLTLDAYSVAANPTGSTTTSVSLSGTAYQILRLGIGGTSLAFGSIDLSQSAAVGASLLALANGGMNANLTASNGGLFYSTATAGAILSGTATASQVLLSGSSAAPAWSTATYPATTTINQILYSSSANTIVGLATVNGGLLNASATGVPSLTVTPVLGLAGTSTGTIGLSGLTSGVVTIQPQSAAGTFNFNLPITAGTAGLSLLSGGGGSAPMTWGHDAAAGITVGTTTIASGTDTRILYDNAGVLGEYTLTGTGTVAVMQASPSLITPALGVATATSLAIGGATIGSNGLAVTGGIAGSAQIWAGAVSSALSSLTGSTDGYRNSSANVTQFAGENTTASSATQGGFFGGYSNDGAAMASGDRLGGIRAGGSSSASSLRNSAVIGAYADQAWVDVSAYGSRWEFQTTNNGNTSASTKLILGNAGVLSFGATAANTVPALKPSSADLQVRLGDDSAFSNISAAGVLVNGSSSGAISILGQAAAGTFNFNLPTTAGTSTYVLTSAGGGSSPMTWTAPGSLAVGLTVGSTAISGGTTTRILYDNAGVLGEYTTVPLAVGGTNANLTASNGGIFYSTASAGAILSGTATAGQHLQSGVSSAPSWTTSTYPATSAAGTILASGTANTITATATPTLGVATSVLGTLSLCGNTSGTVLITPQATAGSPTLTLPTASGTFGCSATAPITLNATTGAIGVTAAALTKVDDTNVTLTLGGAPTTALLAATSITAGWTGQLGLTRGGTAASLTASNGGIVYSTASALAILSGTATANQVLLSGSSTTPAWSTATYPASTTINQLLYSSSANTIAGLATANGGMLNASSSGVPSMTITPTLGVQQTSQGKLVLSNTAAGAFALTLQSSNSATAAYALTFPVDAGVNGQLLTTNGSGTCTWTTVSGTGTVTGPVSSTDNALVRWDGAGGIVIQNSGIIIDDSNNITGIASATISKAGLGLDVTNSTDATSNQIAKWSGANATRAANDKIYQSYFLANSTGTQKEFGRAYVAAPTVTNTSEDGQYTWAVMSAGSLTDSLILLKASLKPAANDLLSLGVSGTAFSDLFLASGGVVNWNAGDVTITHAANTLTFAGAASGYVFNDGSVGIGQAPSAALDIMGVAEDTFRIATTGDAANRYDIGRVSADGFLKFTGRQSSFSGYYFYNNVTDLAFSIGNTGTCYIAGALDLGNASDTTISRSAAGVIAVEGVPLYSNIPQNSQSADYTLVLGDAQKHIYQTGASKTNTIPANSSVAFPIGTAITFVTVTNATTIAITSDTLILAGAGTTGSRTLGANSIATAIKTTSTAWLISGVGLS